MRVNVFGVDDAGNRAALQGEADLAHVMGDEDAETVECVAAQLEVQGIARIGGGAAPLFELERIAQ